VTTLASKAGPWRCFSWLNLGRIAQSVGPWRLPWHLSERPATLNGLTQRIWPSQCVTPVSSFISAHAATRKSCDCGRQRRAARSATKGYEGPRSATKRYERPRRSTKCNEASRSATKRHKGPRSATKRHEVPRSATRRHEELQSAKTTLGDL